MFSRELELRVNVDRRTTVNQREDAMTKLDDDTIASVNKLMKQVVDLMNGSGLDDAIGAMIMFGVLREMLRGTSPERRGAKADWMMRVMHGVVEDNFGEH
jgi:hypothetical protein